MVVSVCLSVELHTVLVQAAAVVAVARAGAEQPWQFVLAPGEAKRGRSAKSAECT